MREILQGLAGNRELKEMLAPAILSEPPGLSHAYIVEGPEGSGRRTFAAETAASLVCENRGTASQPLPCRRCPTCRKIFSGIHPDFTSVSAGEGRQTIGVDSVRALRDDVCIRPVELDYKFIVIEEADRMTAQAQNALLLTLEEPPSYAVFFLTCQSSGALLETVVSRSQTLRMRPLDRDELSELIRSISPAAAALSKKDPDRFEEIIEESGGYAGAALKLLSAGPKDGEAAETAERFISLASDAAHPAEAALCLLKGTPNRDAASALFSEILARAEELLRAKAGVLPAPGEDGPAAAFSTRRLAAICDAASSAISDLQRSRNVRLTVMKFLNETTGTRGV